MRLEVMTANQSVLKTLIPEIKHSCIPVGPIVILSELLVPSFVLMADESQYINYGCEFIDINGKRYIKFPAEIIPTIKSVSVYQKRSVVRMEFHKKYDKVFGKGISFSYSWRPSSIYWRKISFSIGIEYLQNIPFIPFDLYKAKADSMGVKL